MSEDQVWFPPRPGKYGTLLRWAAVLFPCALLLQLSYEFGVDWVNNLWLVTHTASHLRHHGSLPQTYNTEEVGGLPLPLFYGYLLYPLLGAAGACLGAPLTLRLAVIGTLGLQLIQVRSAARRAGADDRLATAASCLVIWAIYPLTNLYSRCALSEFFATGLLTCAVCQWFALLHAETRGERLRAGLGVGLFYSLAGGFHPITALYGLVFLVGLVPTLLFPQPGTLAGGMSRRSILWARCRALVPAAVLTLLVLAPWIFACLRFRKALPINYAYRIYLYPDNLDLWWARFFPLPLDVRTWTDPVSTVSTPFLDTQVNVPLLLLVAGVVWGLVRSASGGGRHGRWWLVLPALGAALSLWMSLDKYPYTVLLSDFRAIQFPYRMVTYFNLAVLVALLLAVRIAGRQGGRTPGSLSPTLLKVVLALSALGVFIKVVHAPLGVAPAKVKDATLPFGFYGFAMYSSPFSTPPVTEKEIARLKRIRLPLGEDDFFGEYQPAEVCLDETGYVAVPIQVFPWNRFFVDGQPVPARDVRVWHGNALGSPAGWDRGPYSVVPVSAGRHVIEYRFVPETTWVWLSRIAYVVIVLWSVGLIAVWIRKVTSTCRASGAA